MEKRQAQLLKLVVEEYIRTALPIGSSQIEEMGVLEVSAATIRNELRDLEELGYLTHPHTSAGRIPTQKGYEYYLEHLAEKTLPHKSIQEALLNLHQNHEGEQKIKEMAKYIAEIGNGAVIAAFDPHRIYYTGISYLFSQPEFQNIGYTIRVSSLFDHCEEHIQEFFDRVVETDMKVFIGEQNPMGSMCSAVAVRLGESLFVLVCPMRMDYPKNIALLDFIKKLF
jgi:heat-inducible transcriptional repressor